MGGFANAIAFYVISYIYHTADWAKPYLEFFSPTPRKLRLYFAFLGLDVQDIMYGVYDTSFGKAMFCIAFLVGVSAVCTAVSYALLRKRET